MRNLRLAVLLAACVAIAGIPGSATGRLADDASDNITRLARQPLEIDKDVFAQGSDLAFQGNLLIAGSFEGFGIYKILKKKPYIKQISFYPCPGSQGDVSVWGRYVFYSIDAPASNTGNNSVCNNTDESVGKEGIRVVDIKNPRRPRQVKFIETDCGSHTHTLVPEGKNIYVYVESYPLTTGQGPTCNAATHRKISIARVPVKDPTKATVVATPDVGTTIGCHDVTVSPSRKLAVAACITQSQLWDISSPGSPEILATIRNPQIQIHHSSAFTWDGKYIALGDEYGGAAAPGGCSEDEESTVGAMWFYNIEDPSSPELAGHHHIARMPPPPNDQAEAQRYRCTTHNFNILPMKDPKKYIAVSSYYAAGLSVIDFSDPTDAKEIGHFLPGDEVLSDMWSAYWYNGRIYTNDHGSRFGVSVFEMDGLDKKQVRYFDDRLNPQVQIYDFK